MHTILSSLGWCLEGWILELSGPNWRIFIHDDEVMHIISFMKKR